MLVNLSEAEPLSQYIPQSVFAALTQTGVTNNSTPSGLIYGHSQALGFIAVRNAVRCCGRPQGPHPALDMRWWGIYMFVGARPAQGSATKTADNELSFTCGRLQAKNWGKYDAWGESLGEAN